MQNDRENWERVKARLATSKFRSGFHLNSAMLEYCRARGKELIRRHCLEFVRQRLAPAHPENDGRQTPWNGHPCFVAQHATGCCCRRCLQTWHRIPEGRTLSTEEIQYIAGILICWIEDENGFLPVTAKEEYLL